MYHFLMVTVVLTISAPCLHKQYPLLTAELTRNSCRGHVPPACELGGTDSMGGTDSIGVGGQVQSAVCMRKKAHEGLLPQDQKNLINLFLIYLLH